MHEEGGERKEGGGEGEEIEEGKILKMGRVRLDRIKEGIKEGEGGKNEGGKGEGMEREWRKAKY